MSDVLAATLVAPGALELRSYPYPEQLEPGAVLLQMLASGICGTDKHTFRGETEQYAGTDHARTTPFPIIQGHENVGVVADVGAGGAADPGGEHPQEDGARLDPLGIRIATELQLTRSDERRRENVAHRPACSRSQARFRRCASADSEIGSSSRRIRSCSTQIQPS